MSFWSVFLKTQKKKLFWPFLTVINFFLVHLKKNIDQNNICASTVLKAKTEEKNSKKLVDPQMSFETKTLNKIFLHIFLFLCAHIKNLNLVF